MRLTYLLFSLLLLSLTACSTNPPQRYLLETRSTLSALQDTAGIHRIGLLEVELPAYMNDEKIVSIGPGNQLILDSEHRWAEPAQLALARSLSSSLRNLLKADVLSEPFPRGYDPQLRLKVSFDRMLWNRGTDLQWSGQFVLIDGEGRSVKHIQGFEILQAVPATTHQAYFEASSAAVNELATLIAQAAITHNRSKIK